MKVPLTGFLGRSDGADCNGFVENACIRLLMTDAPSPIEDAPQAAALQEMVGYLNFSEGASDAKFLQATSQQFAVASSQGVEDPMAWVVDRLMQTAQQLNQQGGAFADISQATAVLQIIRDKFRPAYREFHKDLLWHRQQEELWGPYFFGRVIEALLAQGPSWDEADRIVQDARDQLDNYIGYRPVAVLESEQRLEPYRHEWVRPIPLYIQPAGVAYGPYQALIEQTLKILRQTDASLLREAWFDFDLLDELALDPRAYDFDHPVNKRPNYHFGQWDPHTIDQRGFYRRFVLHTIVLDSLLSRVGESSSDEPEGSFSKEELLFEAAAVLAGTMLMASGTSGDGPGRHSSDVTLSTLLPHIAGYRDRFYEQLLHQAEGQHGKRLRAEAERLRQPFAGARQHLNQELARRRAEQMQHVRLAQVYARMGYPEAALRQAETVRVASSRMLSQIYCRLTDGHHAIDNRKLDVVGDYLPEIEDLLNRGIESGALVDPWNVVGFGGNFSLFPALENTVHDYRVDELILLVEQILDLCSRAWTEAAAVDDAEYEDLFSSTLGRLSDWWDKYATSTVSGVRRLVAKETEISTNLVAGALNAWHKAGAASGDVGFWRLFVEQFDTPKAFQLVIEALLDKGDLVASMALMMQWISQADYTPLADGDASFHPLAERWLRAVEADQAATGEDRWPLVTKFFAHLEASAEEAWHVPQFELGEEWVRHSNPIDDVLDGMDDDEEDADPYDSDGEFDESLHGDNPYQEEDEEDDELDNLFSAAYEDVTFRDSSDDGMDSAIFEPDGEDETDYEFRDEAERLEQRLEFLSTVAKLWKHTAIAWGTPPAVGGGASDPAATKQASEPALFQAWEQEATSRHGQLIQLLEVVHNHRLVPPRSSHEAMVEYDRRRMIKDALTEQIIAACVDMSDAGRLLRAATGAVQATTADTAPTTALARTIELLRSILAGDTDTVRLHWEEFCQLLLKEELLYIPLSKGGSPGRIIKARALHRLIHDLLEWLPRLGMIREACELLHVAQQMEIDHPVGSGAVTEYDHLFEIGYEAIVRCFVASAERWSEETQEADASADGLLVQALQDLTEAQLKRWLQHSMTVRLSVVERVSNENEWKRFVDFVSRYGEDLFTQRFLSLANLRAILHQRVSLWLSNLQAEPDDHDFRLLDEIGQNINRDEAIDLLSMALESVVENYREYRDYNSTTTQSDHGELLYTFVDFLRLRSAYDRIAWNLKPVYLAHKILVSQDRPVAAEMWRNAVAERTTNEADLHLAKFAELCQKYGMRLPTVAERLAERFIRPLTIDRLRALVRVAMTAVEEQAPRSDKPLSSSIESDPDTSPLYELPSFQLLEAEINSLMQEPCGAGLDAPDWVSALEHEVTLVRLRRRQQHNEESSLRHPQTQLSWQSLQDQLGS